MTTRFTMNQAAARARPGTEKEARPLLPPRRPTCTLNVLFHPHRSNMSIVTTEARGVDLEQRSRRVVTTRSPSLTALAASSRPPRQARQNVLRAALRRGAHPVKFHGSTERTYFSTPSGTPVHGLFFITREGLRGLGGDNAGTRGTKSDEQTFSPECFSEVNATAFATRHKTRNKQTDTLSTGSPTSLPRAHQRQNT